MVINTPKGQFKWFTSGCIYENVPDSEKLLCKGLFAGNVDDLVKRNRPRPFDENPGLNLNPVGPDDEKGGREENPDVKKERQFQDPKKHQDVIKADSQQGKEEQREWDKKHRNALIERGMKWL